MAETWLPMPNLEDMGWMPPDFFVRCYAGWKVQRDRGECRRFRIETRSLLREILEHEGLTAYELEAAYHTIETPTQVWYVNAVIEWVKAYREKPLWAPPWTKVEEGD